MGSGIEYGIGFLKMTLLYLITGFGGNLLSSVMNPAAYGVGASTAVFGLVGFYVAYIFTNWQFMGRVGWGQRVFLILYTSIMIVLNFAKSDPKVDNWGHLGGLITGIFAGFAISEWFDAEARSKERIPDRFTEIEYENKYCCCKVCSKIRVGTIFLFLWLFALLVLFYTVVDVNVEQGNIDDDT
jgi:rhomboid protease GluP